MKNWKKVRLGDICKISTGNKNTQDKTDNGKYPFFVRSQTVEHSNSYYYDCEAILTAGDGVGVGKVFHYINGKFDCHQRVYIINNFSDLCYGKYIFYYFKMFFYSRVRKMSAKNSVDSVRYNIIADMPINLPIFEEQQKIAEILSTQDKVIELKQKLIDRKKQQKKWLMQNLLTGRIRLKGFEGEWEKVQFKDLYYKISEKNNLDFGKDRIISVANMYYNSNAKITDNEYLRTYNIFRVGDIAFEGNKSKNFAYGRFVENTIGDGIISHIFDVFRPLDDLNLSYWKYAVNYENVMGRILKRCTKSATMMNNLVADDFLKEFISVPPIEEQTAIAEILSVQDKEIQLLEKELEQEKLKKKSLMQFLLKEE